MEFNSRISGISELDRTFANLPSSTRRKAALPAMRAGAFVIRDMARDNVKAVTSNDSTGILENNLRVYTLRNYRGNLRVGVMVKKGLTNQYKIVNGEPVRVGLYAAVLEFGKEGQPPRSWIRKAIREGETTAVGTLTIELNKRMVDAVSDARKK